MCLVQFFSLFPSWGSGSAGSPNCVMVSPVPSHAECVKVLGFAGTAASAGEVATVSVTVPRGMLQLTASRQLQQTSLGNMWKKVPYDPDIPYRSHWKRREVPALYHHPCFCSSWQSAAEIQTLAWKPFAIFSVRSKEWENMHAYLFVRCFWPASVK